MHSFGRVGAFTVTQSQAHFHLCVFTLALASQRLCEVTVPFLTPRWGLKPSTPGQRSSCRCDCCRLQSIQKSRVAEIPHEFGDCSLTETTRLPSHVLYSVTYRRLPWWPTQIYGACPGKIRGYTRRDGGDN
jgi:hypothetical protein